MDWGEPSASRSNTLDFFGGRGWLSVALTLFPPALCHVATCAQAKAVRLADRYPVGLSATRIPVVPRAPLTQTRWPSSLWQLFLCTASIECGAMAWAGVFCQACLGRNRQAGGEHRKEKGQCGQGRRRNSGVQHDLWSAECHRRWRCEVQIGGAVTAWCRVMGRRVSLWKKGSPQQAGGNLKDERTEQRPMIEGGRTAGRAVLLDIQH